MARGIMACGSWDDECVQRKKSSTCSCEVRERVRYFFEVLCNLEEGDYPFDDMKKADLKDVYEQLFQDIIFAD